MATSPRNRRAGRRWLPARCRAARLRRRGGAGRAPPPRAHAPGRPSSRSTPRPPTSTIAATPRCSATSSSPRATCASPAAQARVNGGLDFENSHLDLHRRRAHQRPTAAALRSDKAIVTFGDNRISQRAHHAAHPAQFEQTRERRQRLARGRAEHHRLRRRRRHGELIGNAWLTDGRNEITRPAAHLRHPRAARAVGHAARPVRSRADHDPAARLRSADLASSAPAPTSAAPRCRAGPGPATPPRDESREARRMSVLRADAPRQELQDSAR